MTTHSESRVVPHSADLMFQVVADVEKYPEFLPWVKALHIVSREHVKGRDVLKAQMTVGFKGFQESYISRVILDPAARSIDVAQTEGPFRILENHWRFAPEGEGCKVDFTIQFEFRNPVLNMVAGAAFGRVLLRTTDAFLDRARKLSKKLA
ncbi:MAG TPA: type II toxin-antitoxin system RatA family toxin [Rhizomicrobium sp.]|nr:type II toxin-antitoxin system RatA family toxin [Rhizomicrobium sp.]